MKLGSREILYTTSCAENQGRGHWHASHETPYRAADGTKVGTSSVGTGHCFTLPAALVWLATGLARKPVRG